MANFDVSNADFSTVLRELEITDRGHADTFNPLFLRLIKNDAFLKAYVDQQISNLINGAPGALDTLKELADALGDDANFKTTVLTTIASKVAQTDFNSHASSETAHGIGDKSQLKTTAKDTIVNALNELKNSIPSVPVQSVNNKTGSVNLGASDITVADSSKHFTSNPKTIENVLAELFTNVDNGQSNVYSAIVGKGVTPASKQFIDLAAGINTIARGQGNAVESQVRAGVKFSNSDGTLRTGTLPVQATAAQTITPGTSNIIKNAGIYDGAITIAGDTNLASANIKSGATIFGVSGKSSVVDTADATATSSQISNGQTAYVNGSKVTGTNNYMVGAVISEDNLSVLYSAGTEIWNKSDVHHAFGIKADDSGNVYVVYAFSNQKTVRKLDSAGNEIWSNSNYNTAYSVAIDNSGNVYVVYSYDTGGKSLVKYNSSGVELWSKTDLGGARNVAVDSSGNVYVVYYQNSGTKSVRKFDSAGNEIWSNSKYSGAFLIVIDKSDNIFVAYATTAIVVEYNSSGAELWQMSIGNLNKIAVDNLNNIYLASGTNGIEKYSISNNVVLWSNNEMSYATGVAVDNSRNVYVIYSGVTTTVTLKKFNSSGTLLWEGTGGQYPYDIYVDNSMNLYIAYANGDKIKPVRKLYGSNIYTIKS